MFASHRPKAHAWKVCIFRDVATPGNANRTAEISGFSFSCVNTYPAPGGLLPQNARSILGRSYCVVIIQRIEIGRSAVVRARCLDLSHAVPAEQVKINTASSVRPEVTVWSQHRSQHHIQNTYSRFHNRQDALFNRSYGTTARRHGGPYRRAG